MNTILVLYPTEFNSQTKLERKIALISSNMMEYSLTSISDANSLLKNYALSKSISFIDALDLRSAIFTHAIIFEDGETFIEETRTIKEMGIPIRLIKIKITSVINIQSQDVDLSHKESQDYEYIGRGSKWGNPHSMFTGSKEKNNSLSIREDVIRKYKYDFDNNKLALVDKSDFLKLAGKKLGCFCKPFACHGDVIADYLNSWDDGQ